MASGSQPPLSLFITRHPWEVRWFNCAWSSSTKHCKIECVLRTSDSSCTLRVDFDSQAHGMRGFLVEPPCRAHHETNGPHETFPDKGKRNTPSELFRESANPTHLQGDRVPRKDWCVPIVHPGSVQDPKPGSRVSPPHSPRPQLPSWGPE